MLIDQDHAAGPRDLEPPPRPSGRRVRHVNGTMSDSDALLWTIGRDPILRSPVMAVLVLDRSPDLARLEARLDALTRAVPRLRSRAEPRPGRVGPPRWVEDDTFDLGLHLGHLALPGPGSLRQVLDVAQQMDSMAFDPELPLWQAMVVDGLVPFGGDEGDGADGAAVIVKVHHSVVDGVGGIGVLGRLLDVGRDRDADAARRAPGSHHRDERHDGGAPGWLAWTAPIGWMASTSRAAVSEVARTVTRPVEQLGRLRDTASSVARLVAPSGRPLSPIMTGRGLDRRFEILDYPVSPWRDAAGAVGGTLNDIFLASVLGGLARYHRSHGVDVERLRALMPVNIRSEADGVGGNRFVPARFVIETAEDAADLVRRVHAAAAEWKHAPALTVSDRLAQALNHLPPSIATAVFGGMLKGSDFVATNVPGPPVETFLAGSHVDRIFAFAPPSGAGLSVALLTPAEHVCIGMNIDHAAVPDGPRLAACLDQSFTDVLALGRPRRSVRTRPPAGRRVPVTRAERPRRPAGDRPAGDRPAGGATGAGRTGRGS